MEVEIRFEKNQTPFHPLTKGAGRASCRLLLSILFFMGAPCDFACVSAITRGLCMQACFATSTVHAGVLCDLNNAYGRANCAVAAPHSSRCGSGCMRIIAVRTVQARIRSFIRGTCSCICPRLRPVPACRLSPSRSGWRWPASCRSVRASQDRPCPAHTC